jgi:hypothetical protein
MTENSRNNSGQPDLVDSPGVEANARLTGTTGVVILILFVPEVATVVLKVTSVLSLHIALGLLLVPPVLLKLGSTTWRMANYYRGITAYRRRGPPPTLHRMLGPILGILMVLLLASGIVLIVGPGWMHTTVLGIHKVTFYLVLLAITAHTGSYFTAAVGLVARDIVHRRRAFAPGVGYRWTAVLGSVLLGALLAFAVSGHATPYLHQYYPGR